MQNFPLNIFIAMALCSNWLQLRARQDCLGSTLISGPLNKENKITYVPAKNLKNLLLLHFFYLASPIHQQKKMPYVLEEKTMALRCALAKKNALRARQKQWLYVSGKNKNNARNVKYRISQSQNILKRYNILFCKILAIPLDTQKSIADTKYRDTLPMLPNPVHVCCEAFMKYWQHFQKLHTRYLSFIYYYSGSKVTVKRLDERF